MAGVAPAEDPSQLAPPERGYAIAWRINQMRGAGTTLAIENARAIEPTTPWEVAKDQFGAQGADFIGVMGALMVRTAKDEFRAYLIDPTRLSSASPPPRKTKSRLRPY